MRHYVPKKNNPDRVPHDLYMAMFYLIRDYAHVKCGEKKDDTPRGTEGKRHHQLVAETAYMLEAEYKRLHEDEGLDALRAFFDYPYFSFMFESREGDMGASKRQWNLFRCRFINRLGKKLGLVA